MLINSNLDVFKQAKILIIDDIPENIEVLANIIKLLGAKLFIALDGEQGIAIAMSKKPDLILLDVQMPGIDGYEVCRRLKSNDESKDIPVIFVTAKDGHEDILAAFESGGVDIIAKPFNDSELTVRAKTHLELKFAKDKIVSQNSEMRIIQSRLEEDTLKLSAMNEELLKTHSELRSLNGIKDKLFKIISDDLKNPIQALLFAGEALSRHIDKLGPEELKNQHNNVFNAAQYMSRQLDNLLYWAKLQLGGANPHFTEINLLALVERNLKNLSIEAEKKGVKFANELTRDTRVVCDGNSINTVIYNILDNAVINSRPNGQITINSEISDDRLALSVEDNGLGMEEDFVNRIFDQNFLLTHKKEKNKGIGLGLLIAQELVKLNGALITVESKKHFGSKFTIIFKKNKKI